MIWYSMFLLCTAQMYSQSPFPILSPSAVCSLVCVLYVLYCTVQCTVLHPNSTSVHKFFRTCFIHCFLRLAIFSVRKISFEVLWSTGCEVFAWHTTVPIANFPQRNVFYISVVIITCSMINNNNATLATICSFNSQSTYCMYNCTLNVWASSQLMLLRQILVTSLNMIP